MESPWPPPTTLVEAARRGEPASLESLYRAMQPRLRAFLRYQGFRRVDRDELASDISSTIADKLPTLRNAQAFEAWFWVVARNQIRGRLRKARLDARLTEPLPPAPLPPDELVVDRDEHRSIRAALRKLTVSDRELLWLHEVENLSYREIGGRLGVAIGTVRVRCHRARRRLEAAYNAESDPPAGSDGTGTSRPGDPPR